MKSCTCIFRRGAGITLVLFSDRLQPALKCFFGNDDVFHVFNKSKNSLSWTMLPIIAVVKRIFLLLSVFQTFERTDGVITGFIMRGRTVRHHVDLPFPL